MAGENIIYITIDYINDNEQLDETWPIEDGRDPLDLTAATLAMKIKRHRDDADEDALLECTNGNSRLTAPAVGVIRLIIPPGSLPLGNDYVFDALYTLGGVPRILWEGEIKTVRKGIT